MSKTKPRIAVFWDRMGGITEAKIAGEEVKQLNNVGINTDLLLIERCPPNKYEHFLSGIAIENLQDQAPAIFRKNFKIPGFSFLSSSHIFSPLFSSFTLTKKYDILITHQTFTCFTAYSLQKYRNIPYLALIWDPITYILQKVYVDASLSFFLPILKIMGYNLDKIISSAAKVVILPSRYHLNLMKRITDKPIEIVYPGTDPAIKIPDERGKYLLAVARWERGKKPFFVLDVLEGLKKKGVTPTLSMVGRWRTQKLRENFLKDAKRRGVEKQINLFGHVNEIMLKKLYFGTRVLLHPINESFGMIGLEAAAHGAPIIIPRNSGVTDLFKDGVHGYFPMEGDVNGYVENIARLLTNERLAWKMGHKAWKVSKQYTWKNHANELKKVIQRFI
jgi:glycosyltransferase involved in cell wall biosynthesis